MRPVRPLVVWDVDGTLVDSRASIHACLVAGFRAAGLEPPTYDEGRRIVGLSLPVAMAELAPPGASPPVLDALVEGYKAHWQAMHAEDPRAEPLYPGAAELLARLKGEGWKVAMATGKSRRGVEAALAAHGWADLFDSTHCADDGPGKPHPAMLQAALGALDARPGEAVMVGDTCHDMAMARAAGVRALGVAWGFHTADEVRAGGADHVSTTFADLGAELSRFARSLRAAA